MKFLLVLSDAFDALWALRVRVALALVGVAVLGALVAIYLPLIAGDERVSPQPVTAPNAMAQGTVERARVAPQPTVPVQPQSATSPQTASASAPAPAPVDRAASRTCHDHCVRPAGFVRSGDCELARARDGTRSRRRDCAAVRGAGLSGAGRGVSRGGTGTKARAAHDTHRFPDLGRAGDDFGRDKDLPRPDQAGAAQRRSAPARRAHAP